MKVPDEAVEAASVPDMAIANLYLTVGNKTPRRIAGAALIHNGGKPREKDAARK